MPKVYQVVVRGFIAHQGESRAEAERYARNMALALKRDAVPVWVNTHGALTGQLVASEYAGGDLPARDFYSEPGDYWGGAEAAAKL